MLKTRIVTAFLLFSAFLLALFLLPPIGWVAFATLISAIAAWEWGGLAGMGQAARIGAAGGFVLICTAVALAWPAALALAPGFTESAWLLGRWFYLPAAVFWIVVAPLWLRGRWRLPRSWAALAVGALLILPTWLALIQLRQAGAWTILAILMLIWLADVAAYFAGRVFGKRKLAPNISPGKTWEGAIGGIAGVLICGMALTTQLPEGYLRPSGWAYFILPVALVALTAISIVGDLFESLLKRQVGIKDSSAILPGHGGVLDRIDSQISTLPLVALIWLTLH